MLHTVFCTRGRISILLVGCCVKYLTPCSRVLKKLRIRMFYPKICMFSIQIDRFSLLFKVIWTRNPNFLTDNKYGPRKRRVLICNIYTPLSAAPFLGLCHANLQVPSRISSQSVIIIFLPVYIQVSK